MSLNYIIKPASCYSLTHTAFDPFSCRRCDISSLWSDSDSAVSEDIKPG